MNDKPSDNRIPFESLAEKKVASWALPNMPITINNNRPNIRNFKQSSLKEKIETVQAEETPSKLTATELKVIAEEAHKEGYSEGYAEGLRKGTEQGKEKGTLQGKEKAYKETQFEIKNLQNRLQSIADSLFDPMESQQENIENIIVDMAVNYAQCLIEKELQHSPHALYDVVSKAVSSIPVGSQSIVVSLNSKDAELLESINVSNNEKWTIQCDETIKSGGCKVETKTSLIDYTIESRLADFIDVVNKGDPEDINDNLDVKSWRIENEKNIDLSENLELNKELKEESKEGLESELKSKNIENPTDRKNISNNSTNEEESTDSILFKSSNEFLNDE